jgi:hypothetical protein
MRLHKGMTRTAVVATALAVITGYSTWAPASFASAATLSGSSFEIDTDANLVVDTAGNLDWADGAAMRSGVLVNPDNATGSNDNSFTTGTHEDSAVPTLDTGGIPPNKSDLKQFGVYTEKTATQVFLNVFWSRVQDPSGDTNMDFEFNQSAVMKNNPVGSAQIVPVRTTGDLLLTYDLSNGGSVATISKRFWNGVAGAWGPATALTATQALGSINSSTITAGDSGGLGSLSPRTFGEASVDLNALIPVSGGCLTYGSAYLKSRSSDSFNSALKDFIEPEAVSVSNCGAIKVHKTNGARAALAGAGFTLYKDDAPTGGAVGPEDTTVVATKTTDAAGNLTFTDVKKGDYWVVETTVPAGHAAAADQHVSITTGDQVVQLNLDDPFLARTDLGVSVTATGSKAQDDLWTISKAVDKTTVNIADGGSATFNYTVTATPNGHVDGSYALAGSVHVSNPNTLDDITADITVTSNVGGGVSCTVTNGTGVTVPKSGSVDRAYSCTFTGAPAAGTVTAKATWDAAAAHTPDGSATGAAPATFPVGTETHKTVTVVDDKTDPANPVTLGTADHANAPTVFTYSLTKNGVAGKCTPYTNTAVLTQTSQSASKTVNVCVGQDLVVTKTALTSEHRTYLWRIAKDVDQTVRHVSAGGTATFGYAVTATPDGTTDSGWTLTGQINVTNPNNWEAITADVSDQVNVGGGGVCTVNGNTHVTVAPSSTESLSYSCSFTSAPAGGTNTATATWDSAAAHTPTGSATGTAAVAFVPTSSSNATITVVDDKTDPAHPVTLGTATWSAGPTTFTYSLDKAGSPGACADYTNTASIAETGQSASKTVTVCSGADLTSTVTAEGSFVRDDLWSIAKAVDRTTSTASDGSVVTFHYSVTAAPAGFADSGYTLGGTVTVSNPNNWEAVTSDTVVTTDLGGGATCAVTDGTGRSVPAGGSVTLAYSCSFTDVPAMSGTVTAITTWNGAAASTPTAASTATADAELVKASEAHSTVTVSDDKTDPKHPVTLGTATWADGPTVFSYDLQKTAAGTTCTTYTNVAQIVETKQTASQDVDVCGQFTGGGGTITPPAKGGGSLVFTGSYTLLMLELAAGALTIGGFLLMLGRRRRS